MILLGAEPPDAVLALDAATRVDVAEVIADALFKADNPCFAKIGCGPVRRCPAAVVAAANAAATTGTLSQESLAKLTA